MAFHRACHCAASQCVHVVRDSPMSMLTRALLRSLAGMEAMRGEQGLPSAKWERGTLNSLVSLPQWLPDDLV